MGSIEGIADAIKLYIFTKGITPFEFSKSSGISQSGISRLLNKQIKRLNSDSKDALERFFKIPFEQIEKNPHIINFENNERSNIESKKNIVISNGQMTHSVKIINALKDSSIDEQLNSSHDLFSVTPDIEQDCFAVVMPDDSMSPQIAQSDVLVFKPYLECDKLSHIDKKIIIAKESTTSKILIGKAIIDDGDVFLKRLNVKPKVIFIEDTAMIYGWLREMVRKLF
tara:strand:- start:8835 stop:9512 length:678 start_codon:yes stop_codon:yes gene_type:complete